MRPEFSMSDIKDMQVLREYDFSILFKKKQQTFLAGSDQYKPLEKLSVLCTEVLTSTIDYKTNDLIVTFIEDIDFTVHRYISNCVGDKIQLNGVSFYIESCSYEFRANTEDAKLQEIHAKLIVRKANDNSN